MKFATAETADELEYDSVRARTDMTTNASAVSWGAIFAGAAAAAALSMILLVLGTGLGLSSISPWAQRGASAKALGVSAVVWITVTQLLASGMGGYLAGRLRARWVGAHTDEVYFRDTAHGFLAWCVASLVTAAVLSSVIASAIDSGVQAGASLAGGAAATTAAAGVAATAKAGESGGDQATSASAYFVDSLFRADQTATSATPAAADATSTAAAPRPAPPVAEVTRIFSTALASGSLPPEDARYVGQVVAQRTGLSADDAQKRVTTTFDRLQTKLRDAETAAREAADKARHAAIYASLWLFVSLLAGAFAASLSATWGGRERDA